MASLMSYFPDKSISLHAGVRDWQQAIDVSMQALVENNYIEPRYVEAIKKSTRENGPYYILTPHIAMPHARPENGVIKTALTLTLLKNGVYFPDNSEPVTLLIGLAASNANSHIDAVRALSEMLSEDTRQEAILNATSVESIKDIVNKF